jgi:hypothetical protein
VEKKHCYELLHFPILKNFGMKEFENDSKY